MSTAKLFLHGVPDSPAIWRPLLGALALDPALVFAPALPGFTQSLPVGFTATKDAYADWAVEKTRTLYDRHGPIDIVGHDWGALIAQRVAMLRPELIRSWAVSNAIVDPDYRGHRVAQMWNTPLLGELLMAITSPKALAKSLSQQGVPTDIAAEEGALFAMRSKRQAILKLYRSANGLNFADNWARDIGNLPERGMMIWGENDPFVDLRVAQRFSERTGTPLSVVRGAGHWAIAERPDEVAIRLKAFWATR